MKKQGVLFGAAALLLLAGCSQKVEVPKSTAKSSSTSQQVKTSKKAKKTTTSSAKKVSRKQVTQTSSSDKAVWSSAKSQALKTYMTSFSQSMNQQYVEYAPGQDGEYYGIQFPDYLEKDKVAVDDQHVTAAWSENGVGQADYQVVGIYSDYNTAPSMGAHLYLFTIHDGQPVVLITEQTQGMPDNLMHFKETANTDLKQNFTQIVGGGSAATANTTKTPSSTANYQVPSELAGTWYGYSEYSDQPDKIDVTTFKGNEQTINGRSSTLHLANERTSEDQAVLDNKSTNIDNFKISNWGLAHEFDNEGRHWLNIRGWYQNAGVGEYYGVKIRDVNGQTMPVLTQAGGAGIWPDEHFYPTKAAALSMKDTKFDDEHNQE
ncbi:DUF4767 domain-containing protein [Latilactobacillus sakei]|uniref:DUF4767 domain-containing protein n=1 Tax=Latilactobacillus sakei TaxID=1599 RepID=A0AAF0GS74_LATSK|nr:DUF4767 domain-containing protein [Latilactobacillus sakei]WGI20061.1 DUF4767 domain-containing protein [Latilactobacillus sakei]